MTSTEGEKAKAVITVRFGCVGGVVAVVRRKKFAGAQIQLQSKTAPPIGPQTKVRNIARTLLPF